MLAVIVKSKQIIIAVVDNQLVGADDIFRALASFRLLLQIVNGIFQILEADFFGNVLFALDHFAHSVVDHGDIGDQLLLLLTLRSFLCVVLYRTMPKERALY